MQIPTLRDVLLARQAIRPWLAPTPFYHYPGLDALTGAQVWVKHENYQPIGSFKIRGGINLVSRLSPDERSRGLLTASTGNHGQSIAYAGRLFGAQVTVVVPRGANPAKVAAIEGFGASVIFEGEQFEDAIRHGEALAAERGLRYVQTGNEPLLIAGVATYALEMVKEVPDLDAIIVPIGSGTGASGLCIAARALSGVAPGTTGSGLYPAPGGVNPSLRVIGVSSAESPAAYESWRARKLVTAENRSFAEGIASGSGVALPQHILWDHLDDFLLVPDSALRRSMVWLIERAHTLAEGAGAAPLAALVQNKEQFAGQKVGIVISGGNSSLDQLRSALNAEMM